jgi:putative oxidoreductase
MLGTRGLSRTLLASTFVVGGLSAWKQSRTLAPDAEHVASMVSQRAGTKISGEQLVKLTAGVQVVGGGLFALGVFPRLLALALGASLLPTTVSGQSFWASDATSPSVDRTGQFVRNAGLLGGLLFAAIDTGGRPSVFWSGRRAAEGLAEAVGATTKSVASTTKSVVDGITPG